MRNGELLKEGDIIKRPKMAKTLRRIAEDEFTFYNGSLAQDIVKDIAEYGKNNTQINVNYIKTVKIQGQFIYTYIIKFAVIPACFLCYLPRRNFLIFRWKYNFRRLGWLFSNREDSFECNFRTWELHSLCQQATS